jgi:hypothetical protein
MSTPSAALQDRQLPIQAKLAAAWTSFMFLYLYVDYLALYKPGFLDDLLAGTVHEFDTGPTFVSLALTLIAIPSLMVVLSMTLPARANRILNLVVAALYIPVTLFNAAGESWSYAYYYGFSIALEVLLLALILRAAWTWPRATSIPDLADPGISAGAGRSAPSRSPGQLPG